MVDFDQALAIAKNKLFEYEKPQDYKLVFSRIETLPQLSGWLFFFNTEAYLETGNFLDGLAGNAPILIDRESGKIFPTGTAEPAEHYVRRFMESKGLENPS